jgi:uncharacterized LabA/DUF88 family protein
MTAQFARAPHQNRSAAPLHTAPHAALLIDFDNVTMGIRSDITKELKNLLNSDIIKGKVAVQRAYADWRRYPQYVVPLAEASVDLIFAPAYGSSKKNATDIRLSIDALELVFTRPEIGTFILLSGDSDFSSMVLKLKEYGKYVVGVGIRESASDLLVQNCDEYYSYSALTGLTRAGEEESPATGDPWELVDLAIQQMTSNNDVMRSDRLKQVLLELDPNFDEKTLGFSKFNRFVSEAANRGVLKLHKLENGQFEIAIADDVSDEPKPERPPRGRGRRGREDREPSARPPRTVQEAPREARPAASPAAAPPAEEQAADGNGRPAAAPAESAASGLHAAYDLLRKAAAELGATADRAVRDSDVKRRMLDFEPDWDEASIGFNKFSRFLRQAHDAEVINLRKIDSGNYEIALPGDAAVEAPKPRGRTRDRRERMREPGTGDTARQPAAASRSDSARSDGIAKAEGIAKAPPAERERPEAASRPVQPPAPKPQPPAPAAEAAPPAPAPSIGLRRGSKGPRLTSPPPLLEGQVVSSVRAASSPPPPAPPRATAPASRARAKPDLAALGLPTGREAIIEHLTKSYKGIGRKTAESLIDAVGEANVFTALLGSKERVREIVGAKRGDILIAAWEDDYARRIANAEPVSGERPPTRRPGRRRGGRGRKKPAPSAG